MTTPSEEEARAQDILDKFDDEVIGGVIWAYDLASALRDLLASRVSTPPIEDWEYGTVSEITSAQVINGAHIDYWRSRGFDIVRRRRATEWEPVPAVPVLATEPEDEHRPVQHRDGKPPWCAACGLTAEGKAPVSRFDHAPTEPEAER